MKLTIKELSEQEDMSFKEMLDTYGMESVVPACCDEGCQVEPDGYCPHGNPSFLIELGVI